MHTAATPTSTGTDQATTCEVSPVSAASRTSKAAATAAASTIRHGRRGKAGSPGDDAGLQEVDERHVHEADVDAHQRGESGRPAGRPKDRRGDQPVGGVEAEVRLVSPRGGDDEGQQEVQRAGYRDADEAEQADEADALYALRGDRRARGLGAGVRHRSCAGTWVSTASVRPRRSARPAGTKGNAEPASRRVSSDTRMGTSCSRVSSWMRAATFTASPMAVYSRRRGGPMSPTITGPLWTPMPMRSDGSPRARRSAFSAASASCMASAQRTARAAWSGWSSGAPK